MKRKVYNRKSIADVNRNKYKIPSGGNFQLRSKNAIYISPSNTLTHELAKTIGAYSLRKFGDIKFDKPLVLLIKNLEDYFKLLMKEFPKEKASFITEACPKQFPNKRRDLVKLEDNWIFEFETSPKRAKRFEEDPEKDHLTVIHL